MTASTLGAAPSPARLPALLRDRDHHASRRRHVLGRRRAARARAHRQPRAGGRDGGGGDAARASSPGRCSAPGSIAAAAAGSVMMLDQVLAASTLVAHRRCSPGTRPNWTVPLVALVAGITWPLSFGGFTSLIPVIVPDELLAAGERARGDELQLRHDRRAGAGRHDLRARRPGHVAARGGGADARARSA